MTELKIVILCLVVVSPANFIDFAARSTLQESGVVSMTLDREGLLFRRFEEENDAFRSSLAVSDAKNATWCPNFSTDGMRKNCTYIPKITQQNARRELGAYGWYGTLWDIYHIIFNIYIYICVCVCMYIFYYISHIYILLARCFYS